MGCQCIAKVVRRWFISAPHWRSEKWWSVHPAGLNTKWCGYILLNWFPTKYRFLKMAFLSAKKDQMDNGQWLEYMDGKSTGDLILDHMDQVHHNIRICF